MNKLTSLFAVAALSVAATQVNATETWTYTGSTLSTSSLCLFIGCSQGTAADDFVMNLYVADGTTSIDYQPGATNGFADDPALLSQGFERLEVITSGTAFVDICNGDICSFDEFVFTNDGTNVTSFQFGWNGGVKPHGQLQANGDFIFGIAGGGATSPLGCDVGDGTGCVFYNSPMAVGGFASASAVPVPAAAWLFGSAMLGLVGVGRKRRA